MRNSTGSVFSGCEWQEWIVVGSDRWGRKGSPDKGETKRSKNSQGDEELEI